MVREPLYRSIAYFSITTKSPAGALPYTPTLEMVGFHDMVSSVCLYHRENADPYSVPRDMMRLLANNCVNFRDRKCTNKTDLFHVPKHVLRK